MAVEPTEGEAARTDQAAASERDRRAAELRAVRESGLLVQSGNRAAPAADVEPASSARPAAATETTRLAIDPDRDPNAQQRNADFRVAHDTGGDVNAHRLTPRASLSCRPSPALSG